MKILNDEKYQVRYDPDAATVWIEGSLLLNGAPAYEPILDMLTQAAEEQEPNQLAIDLRNLKFLNSSGINMMTKFVMHVGDVKAMKLTVLVIGWKHVAWQEKLTVNLSRLMPALQTQLNSL